MVKKKKIFFLLYSMHVGGVEKSLVNLLSTLSREEYDIHVGLVFPEGDLLPLLPPDVTLHPVTDISQYWNELKQPPLDTICGYIRSGRIIRALAAFFVYLRCKVGRSYYSWVDNFLRGVSGIEQTFDIAVAYAGPSLDIDYYVCYKVKAVQKIGWVHFDISRFGIDRKATRLLYGFYDRIYIVSETGKKIFDQIYSELREKTKVHHNVISVSSVHEQACIGESFCDEYKGKRILTVGRISPEKGQKVAIKALKLLLEKKYDLRWYFVGDGSDMGTCKAMAESLGLNDSVVFLGEKINPYGFMRNCDIYVQPSRHEGYCITLAEALCFSCPVVATRFTGAEDQLINQDKGVVVGMSAEEIASGIELFLT